MKKHLIAAAVAGALAVPAMAQVSITGVIDTGYLSRTDEIGTTKYKRTETGNASAVSTSNLAFRASEDLGGGLKATAFVNQSLNSNTGAFGARDTWVSIGGGFGEVKIGRFTPAFESNASRYSVGSNTVNSAGTIDFMFGGSYNVSTSSGRAGTRSAYADIGRGLGTANGGTVQYTLPKMAGFSAVVGMGETKYDIDATANGGKTMVRQLDAALRYDAGPMSFGVAMVDRSDDREAVAAVASDTSATPIVLGSAAVTAQKTNRDLVSYGASYNLGMATVRLGHIAREDKVSGAATKTNDAKVNSLGVSIPMGATAINLNYLDGEDKADGVAANKRDLKGYQLLAVYSLSKRTNMYLVYGMNEYKGSTVATTSERKDMAVGLRHSF